MKPAALRTLRLALFAALTIAGLLGLAGAARADVALAQTTPARPSGAVTVVQARGTINPSLAQYLTRAIDEAEIEGAAALVIELDTPGGLDSAMRQIIQRILASNVPVIVYVAPSGARAGSAGVYIAYAAHVAAMAPNTTIGSATPVAMGEGGEQQMSPEMRAKVTNDAVAYIRTLAERRGRNADWAEQAVREAANVTETQALALGVVDAVARDVDDLLRQVDGRTVDVPSGQLTLNTAGAAVERVEMGWVDGFLHIISDPTIAYILLSLGTMGLFFELSNPGSLFPGVIGGICLLLGFYALGTLPVNWAGLLLMGFALLLFVAELFTPTSGLLTLGGLAAFVLGSLLLFNVPDAAPWLSVSLWAVAGVSVTMAVFFLVVARLVARGQRRKVTTGREGMLGMVGRARTALAPSGMVFVDGALWEAVSDAEAIPAGTRVEVVGIEGLLLHVRPTAPVRDELATVAPRLPAQGNARPVDESLPEVGSQQAP
ncbi:MAG: nodulation protein NfeD [Chloroflexota bacterium]|nr:nodulation protein NfeD [Chloroflexota bacterium]